MKRVNLHMLKGKLGLEDLPDDFGYAEVFSVDDKQICNYDNNVPTFASDIHLNSFGWLDNIIKVKMFGNYIICSYLESGTGTNYRFQIFYNTENTLVKLFSSSKYISVYDPLSEEMPSSNNMSNLSDVDIYNSIACVAFKSQVTQECGVLVLVKNDDGMFERKTYYKTTHHSSPNDSIIRIKIYRDLIYLYTQDKLSILYYNKNLNTLTLVQEFDNMEIIIDEIFVYEKTMIFFYGDTIYIYYLENGLYTLKHTPQPLGPVSIQRIVYDKDMLFIKSAGDDHIYHYTVNITDGLTLRNQDLIVTNFNNMILKSNKLYIIRDNIYVNKYEINNNLINNLYYNKYISNIDNTLPIVSIDCWNDYVVHGKNANALRIFCENVNNDTKRLHNDLFPNNMTSTINIKKLLSITNSDTVTITSGDITSGDMTENVSIYKDILAIGFNSQNKVYVYKLNKLNFNQYTLFQTISAPVNGNFGYSVKLFENYLIIGSDGYNSNIGKVYVYKNNSGSYELVQEITDPNGVVNDHFGMNINIYKNIMCVISDKDEQNRDEYRTVFIYKYDGTTWNLIQQIRNILYAFYLYIKNEYIYIASLGTEILIYKYNDVEYVKVDSILPPANKIWWGYNINFKDNLIVLSDPVYQKGYVYIYKYNGTSWYLYQTISAIKDDEFGYRVFADEDLLYICNTNYQCFIYKDNELEYKYLTTITNFYSEKSIVHNGCVLNITT